MKKLTILFLIIFASMSIASDIDQAMVKIYTNSVAYNYYIPWSTDAPMESSGSGSIIAGNLILTNAHVVTDQTFLQVRKEGDPIRYQASVVAVSHEADLALITVDDDTFFEGITPMQLGDLPHAREEVVVYGYPMGGDALSTTKGVISRVESSRYAHSGLSLLTVQIDAAINPGNSGGPAIIDNRIIGVAMQTMNQADNIGYVIPVPVIEHFIDDIADGIYEGFPSAGFTYQTIRNEALSERFGIAQEQTGVIVTKTAFNSPSSAVLEIGDILVEIAGKPISGDGTVELRSGNRTRLDYMISRCQLGDTITLRIIRESEARSVEIHLTSTLQDLMVVPNKIYDTPPEYFIYGGIVFMPLSLNYLESWGADWYLNTVDYLSLPFLFDNWRTEGRSQIVVLTFTLPAEVNTGYEALQNEIIDTVNGVSVTDFNQFVELVDASEGKFIEFVTNLGSVLVLNREKAITSNNSIMARYGIRNDRVL